jgi:hypothetical protein
MIRSAAVGLLLAVCTVCSFAGPVNDTPAPAGMQGCVAVGLNYPGLSFRYGMTPKLILEGRYETSEDVSLYGPRGYYVLSGTPEKVITFAGLEGDIVSFKGDGSEGYGTVLSVFYGIEYFINRTLSLQCDFGPAFVSLSDNNSGISQTSVEFVVNLGINYYFKPGGK